ncbi:MAG TPA: universal stress protein [Pseudonocardia sp.]|uniref:universal stress protein n=1 Tax=Pseudonocardia sp. TaxID=60912 RepID=UPI002B4B64A6|nr:universal stress protein [Pseudonocardia sp.]HLU55944.1 universal stress protein [Pseudonocardia sp.]
MVEQQRVIVSLSRPEVDSRVVRTAIEIARALDAVLYAVDVQEPRPSPGTVRDGPPRIQDAYFTLSKSGGLPDDVDVRIVVTQGEPGPALVRLADRHTDLLVVGRGSDGGALGPVARACVEGATCPVVVVPPGGSRLDAEPTRRVEEYAAPARV